MARIVIAGAGVCGLAAGLMLHRDGHEVTVLEHDPAPPDSPEDAWERWDRGGVTQFRMAHYLQPLGHAVLEQELPDVRAALAEAGAPPFNTLCMMPPPLAAEGPRDGDERFMTLAARRTTLELAFARVAEQELDLRRGTSVVELLGAPQVRGVRTDTGEELRADLVVDAMGRRSPMAKWLPLHEEAEDSGFLYYGRHFRGTPPQVRAPINMPIGTITILTLPGDNDTWSVTVYTTTGDQALKRIRDVDRWTAVVASLPLHAHWLDGEPITEVAAMGGVVDRYRRLPDGVTGLALLADAFACSNPSIGRGISLGLRHAQLLRDCAREEDPVRFAAAWDTATEAEVAPWYRDTVAIDRARLHEIEALRDGLPRPRPANPARASIGPAAMRDPDVFRAMLAHRCCLGAPSDLDAVGERALELAADAGPPRTAGPDREQLLALLA